MVKEAYVSFEIAKLLKEKGFDEPTEYVWYEYYPHSNTANKDEIGSQKMDWFFGDEQTERNSFYSNKIGKPTYISKEIYSAPTHQLTMAWLRGKYDLHIIVYPYKADNKKKWCCQVFKTFNLLGCEQYTNETLNSYEEAVEAALKYALENLI